MAEKEVHGGVKFRIDCDDHNHTQVPQHRDCIDGKEDQEEGHLDLWVFWEAGDDEGHSSTLISLIHHYGPCQRKSEFTLSNQTGQK